MSVCSTETALPQSKAQHDWSPGYYTQCTAHTDTHTTTGGMILLNLYCDVRIRKGYGNTFLSAQSFKYFPPFILAVSLDMLHLYIVRFWQMHLQPGTRANSNHNLPDTREICSNPTFLLAQCNISAASNDRKSQSCRQCHLTMLLYFHFV